MAGHVVLVHGMEVRPLPGQQYTLVAQLVERQSPKLGLVRVRLLPSVQNESVAQLVEHTAFNGRALGSNPSRFTSSSEALLAMHLTCNQDIVGSTPA